MRRSIDRRSFLGRVCGASALALGGCMAAGPIEEDPADPVNREPPRGRGERQQGCTDGDSGRHVDPPGYGRGCSSDTRRRRRPGG